MALINYAPPTRVTLSTSEQRGGRGPLFEILFLFLTSSMLLLPCHLVPVFPIYCFAGCVADSSFLPLALCFLLPCFCLPGLPTPPPLSPLTLSSPSLPHCLIGHRQTPSLLVDVLLRGVLWLSFFSSAQGTFTVCTLHLASANPEHASRGLLGLMATGQSSEDSADPCPPRRSAVLRI